MNFEKGTELFLNLLKPTTVLTINTLRTSLVHYFPFLSSVKFSACSRRLHNFRNPYVTRINYLHSETEMESYAALCN